MNYNILSIAIGCLGWGLAILGIVKRGCVRLSVYSMTACALAMMFQFVEYNFLAKIEDVSALLDTAGGRLFGAVVLMTVSLLLNGLNLWLERKR